MAPFPCFRLSERQSLKSLARGSIKIPYEDLEQGSAFTGIAQPSFLSLDGYVNESAGRRSDLQAPTQRESPTSELHPVPLRKEERP